MRIFYRVYTLKTIIEDEKRCTIIQNAVSKFRVKNREIFLMIYVSIIIF